MSKRRVDRSVAHVAMLFAALGDPTRIGLLQHLSRDGPASISVLTEHFRTSRQGVTKHLQVLSSAGLIEGERQGREHVWTLKPDRLVEARQHLDALARHWDGVLARLKAHVEG